MSTVLNHDEFEDEPLSHNYEPHNILYGDNGWTDEIDQQSVQLLIRIGAIKWYTTYSGTGWETNVYISTQGKEPR